MQPEPAPGSRVLARAADVITPLLVVTSMAAMTALYLAADFAAVSVRRSRIRQMARTAMPWRTVPSPILEDASALDRYIAACQVGIMLGSLILGAYARSRLDRASRPCCGSVWASTRWPHRRQRRR